MSNINVMIATAKGYRAAMKQILAFHQDNLCNIGRGSAGCYCMELRNVLLEGLGEALHV